MEKKEGVAEEAPGKEGWSTWFSRLRSWDSLAAELIRAEAI